MTLQRTPRGHSDAMKERSLSFNDWLLYVNFMVLPESHRRISGLDHSSAHPTATLRGHLSAGGYTTANTVMNILSLILFVEQTASVIRASVRHLRCPAVTSSTTISARETSSLLTRPSKHTAGRRPSAVCTRTHLCCTQTQLSWPVGHAGTVCEELVEPLETLELPGLLVHTGRLCSLRTKLQVLLSIKPPSRTCPTSWGMHASSTAPTTRSTRASMREERGGEDQVAEIYFAEGKASRCSGRCGPLTLASVRHAQAVYVFLTSLTSSCSGSAPFLTIYFFPTLSLIALYTPPAQTAKVVVVATTRSSDEQNTLVYSFGGVMQSGNTMMFNSSYTKPLKACMTAKCFPGWRQRDNGGWRGQSIRINTSNQRCKP